MNVVFAVIGVIVVNNELNIVDIQTTSSDICSDQDSCTSGSKCKTISYEQGINISMLEVRVQIVILIMEFMGLTD